MKTVDQLWKDVENALWLRDTAACADTYEYGQSLVIQTTTAYDEAMSGNKKEEPKL